MPRDYLLEQLKASAQREANRSGKPHSVINLNTIGARMLVMREHNPNWESEPRRVLHIAQPST